MLRLFSASLFAMILLLSPSATAQQDEPSVDGKKLSEWRKGLEDPKLAVRVQTISALIQLGPKAAPLAPDLVKVMKEKVGLRSSASAALRAIGPPAVDAIAAGLKEDDTAVRQVLLSILNTFGDKAAPAVAAVAPLLKDTNAGIRQQAVYILVRSGSAGIKELKPLLKDKDSAVRVSIFSGLAYAPPSPELLEIAKAGLKDAWLGVRQQAVQVAARHGKDAVSALAGALEDVHDSVRSGAALALSNLRMDAKPAAPALRKLLKDKAPLTRYYAALALVNMGIDAESMADLVPLLEETYANLNSTVFNALAAHGKDALPHFEKALKSPNVQTRRFIVSNLLRVNADTLPLLRTALKDAAPEVRMAAAESIGSLGEKAKDAVKDLTAALKDAESTVRLAAAGALSRIENDPKATLSILLEALEDSDTVVRGQATRALAAAAKAVSPELFKLLEDKDVALRRRAVLGLSALGAAAGDAIPALVKALADEDAQVRRHAGQALGKFGNAAVKPLIEALKSQDERVRAGAAAAATQVPLSPAVPPIRPVPPAGVDPLTDALTAALKDKAPLVRVHAAHALMNRSRQPNAGYDLLLESVKHEDAAVRREAITALGASPYGRFYAGPQGVKIRAAMTDALEDKDRTVRLRAAFALVPSYGYPYAVMQTSPNEKVATILEEGLRKGDVEERSQSLNALARLGAGAAPAAEALTAALGDKEASVRQFAAYTLAAIGPSAKPAVAALTERLTDRTLAVRQLSAQALAAIGPDAKDAVPALTKTLDDPDVTLRLSAAEALGRIGPPSKPAVPGLVALMKQPIVAGPATPFRPWMQPALGQPRSFASTNVSTLVLEALARIGPGAAGAAPELVRMLEGGAEQRRAAATVLSNLGSSAAPALLKGLESKDAEMRALCAEALGGLNDLPEDAVKALAAAMSDQEEAVGQQAAFALGRLGPAAKPALPRLLLVMKNRDASSSLRGTAAQAIGEIGPQAKDAIPDLRQALKDEDAMVRKSAAQALGGIGPQAKDAAAALSDLERDPDVHVRRAAAAALGRINREP